VKMKISVYVALVFGISLALFPALTVGQKSAQYVQVVGRAPTRVALFSNVDAGNAGQPLQISAVITQNRLSPPTGVVTFTATGTSAANTVVSAPLVLPASGVVVWPITLPNTDTYSVAASYAGDSNYSPSESSLLTQYVGDFALSLPKSITIVKGQSGVPSLGVTSLNHFWGGVQLSCSGSPYKSDCKFAQTSLLFPRQTASDTSTANNPVLASVLTITTAGETVTTVGAFFFLFGFAGLRRKMRFSSTAITLGLLALVVGVCGCAGPNRYVQNDGTPVGSYPITVVGTSGSLTHTTTITLNVVAQ